MLLGHSQPVLPGTACPTQAARTEVASLSQTCWEAAGTSSMVVGMPFGQRRAGGSKAKLKAYKPVVFLVKRESQAWGKAEGEPVPPWRGGGLWLWHWEPAGKSLHLPSRSLPRSLERLVLPMIAWTNSCERASSSPLVSCNYCPSVLLERDHLLLLHHQSSSHLPGVALSPENVANRADGASPEVPRCSLCSIRSKAAAPVADEPAMCSGGASADPPSPRQDTLAKK